MNLPNVDGEPRRVQIGTPDGKTAAFEGVLSSMDYSVDHHGDMGEVKLTITPTSQMEMVDKPTAKMEVAVPAVGTWTADVNGVPMSGEVVAILGPAMRLAGWQPFAYGLAFLLLLWGCMAWEKWILWMM